MKKRFVWILIVAVIISRLLPHLANFTPVLAVWLYFGKKRWNWLPLFSILLSTDLFLSGYHNILLWVWASYLILYAVNRIKNLEWWAGGLFGPIVFFLITNFGVYALGWHETLWQSYLVALPFFFRTLFSTFIWSGVLSIIEAFEAVEARVALRYKLASCLPAKLQKTLGIKPR